MSDDTTDARGLPELPPLAPARARAASIIAALRADPELMAAFRGILGEEAREAERAAPSPPPEQPRRESLRTLAEIGATCESAARSLEAHQARLRAEEQRRRFRRAQEVADRFKRGDFPVEEDVARAILARSAIDTPSAAAVSAALAWAAAAPRRGCVVVLGGERGRGKTVAAARGLLERFERPAFVLASPIAGTPRGVSPEARERWARWLSADGLLVDELGAEPDGDGAALVTGLLLDRYNAGLVTLCTTNLAGEYIRGRYLSGSVPGDTLFHRLAFTQGRVRRGPRGEAVPGEGGCDWYRPVGGENLRDFDVRRKKLSAAK